MEVSAVAGNEVRGPAVLSKPKVMTPVSCLNKICVVTKLSIPQYQSRSEVGVAHMNIWTMEVWVRDMELRGNCYTLVSHTWIYNKKSNFVFTETGHGRTKREAKHEAAKRVLDKLRAAGERNESLHRVTPEIVKKCHEM